MGRLTLDILLTFAQFEREVTGERIRDEIAASKRKGMWMGGTVPLGYDVKERKLVVNPEEARLVVRFFNLYLELGCVSKLKARLDQEGITSKARTSAAGNRSGGTSYYQGALYQILKDRLYLGEIPHRGENHPGQHEAIVPRDRFEHVQALLKSDQGRRNGLKANSPSLLVGLLQDSQGNRFIPSHTLKKDRRYRYYVCQPTADGSEAQHKPIRLPAHDGEQQVTLRLQSFLLAGEVSGARTIARKLSLNERYMSRVLECAFLAPDIVQAILNGYQPSDLTFGRLTRRLPLSWIDQRRQLGFPFLQHTQ